MYVLEYQIQSDYRHLEAIPQTLTPSAVAMTSLPQQQFAAALLAYCTRLLQ